MTMLLHLDQVSKSFGKKTIFQDVTFSFGKGCYAVVAPNGVGKTVLVEMLAGIIHQDMGLIYLQGIGNSKSINYKSTLTYIPGKPSFFPSVTGNEFINFISVVKKFHQTGVEIKRLITGFHLDIHLDTKFDEMSLGTQKKLFLVTLAIGKSKVIIMDEPTNALDVDSCGLLFEIINELKRESIVIFSTHDKRLIDETSPVIMELNSHPVTDFNV